MKRTTREIADEIRQVRWIENEHDAATTARVLLNKDNEVALDGDSISEAGAQIVKSTMAGIPFDLVATVGQSTQSAALIDAASVPEGMSIRVSGFTARVMGGDDWVDADINITGTEEALVATIPTSSLTDGATIHSASTSAELDDAWFGDGQNALAVSLSAEETTGSDVAIRIFGVIA